MRIKRWPHLRDMSLRHKIMTANFLMVFVPVLLIVILGTIIFAGLRFTGTLRQMELALLFITKLDLGRVEFHCELTGLYDYMLEQVNRLRTVWTAQGVEIGFTAAEESGARTAMALLDREEFTRVLDNLLSNAAKYAGEADGSIHVEFALQTTAQAVRLSCRDHGPGVPEAELPHLFESFYRVDRSRGEKPGHGLGMAIASRVVLGMQGRIWAENATDGGLCIIMEFPRHDVGAEADRETEDIPAVEKG